MTVTIDGTVGVTSPDFIPSSSNIPTNGLFLPTTNTIAWATNSTERLRLDASGNLGLGVTPKSSGVNAFEMVNGSLISTQGDGGIGFNSYYNSGWKYAVSNYAARYYFDKTTGAQAWYTAPSGTAGNAISFTQAMTLDASGNLGIGTSSPAGAYRVSLTGNGSSVVGGLALTSNGNTAYIGQVGAASADCEYWNAANGYVRIGTNNVERARIDSSGNLLVGTTTVNGKLSITAGTAATGNSAFFNNLDGTYNPYLQIQHSSTGVALYASSSAGGSASRLTCVAVSNGVYLAGGGTSWTAVSDEREKDIIEPIENAVTKVGSLRAVIGKYKTDEADKRRSFLIAQDVQAVLPEAVDASDPDKLGVQYTDTIPLLVAAIQELTQRLEKLENKNG